MSRPGRARWSMSRQELGGGRRGGRGGLLHGLALAAPLGLGRHPAWRGVGDDDDDDAAAGRAGGVRAEPGVDAGDVEGVAAPRQHPELLPGGQVGQADGALLLLLVPLFHCGDGEGVDSLLL